MFASALTETESATPPAPPAPPMPTLTALSDETLPETFTPPRPPPPPIDWAAIPDRSFPAARTVTAEPEFSRSTLTSTDDARPPLPPKPPMPTFKP